MTKATRTNSGRVQISANDETMRLVYACLSVSTGGVLSGSQLVLMDRFLYRLGLKIKFDESMGELMRSIAAQHKMSGVGGELSIIDKLRLGVCPDCGNTECMADNKTSLWCPSCDASYTIEEVSDEKTA